MNGLPYYKAYPRDFIEGTVGMPFEVKCAYRVVLDLIYMQGGNLPDDARYISGLLGCSSRKWNAIRQQLIDGGKLQVNGEFLTNYRAIIELETLAKLQDKQRENATGTRKNKGLEKPRLNHTEPEPDTEPKKNKEDIPAGAGSSSSSSKYAFKANTIKLTHFHLDGWKKANPHIQVESALWALDGWAGEVVSRGGNWFNAVAGALAKREQEAMQRVAMAQQVAPLRRSGDGRI